MEPVLVERDHAVVVVTINRPEVRNAIDGAVAGGLATAFRAFEADDSLSTAVLTGAGGCFSAGADLRALGTLRTAPDGDAPLGVSRMLLTKPVIAAIEGHAVAGGLELALWCDLRVAAASAVFGVHCRRFGVPLMDGGTIRLPRLVGQGRALDMILTGRAVPAAEALSIGLVDRLVGDGEALEASLTLARELASLPQECMRSDRMSVYEQWSLPSAAALANESRRGHAVIGSGQAGRGAARFERGEGRHGAQLGTARHHR
ncbi:MAG: crotonase/enoyl-CoA hydratase family protein [Candidatus Dormibacteria bacterium]